VRSACVTINTMRSTKDNGEEVRTQAVAWGLALNFVYGFIGFGAIGWALERWVWPAASPWLLIGALGLGLFAGAYRFVRDAIAMNRQ